MVWTQDLKSGFPELKCYSGLLLAFFLVIPSSPSLLLLCMANRSASWWDSQSVEFQRVVCLSVALESHRGAYSIKFTGTSHSPRSTVLGLSQMVTHLVIISIQQGLTLVNSQEPVSHTCCIYSNSVIKSAVARGSHYCLSWCPWKTTFEQKYSVTKRLNPFLFLFQDL